MQPQELRNLGITVTGEEPVVVYHGVGCAHCHSSGYYGRTGLFEVLEVNDAIRELINQGAPDSTIRIAAVDMGMRTAKVTYDPPDFAERMQQQAPVIYTFWHANMTSIGYMVPEANWRTCRVLVSRKSRARNRWRGSIRRCARKRSKRCDASGSSCSLCCRPPAPAWIRCGW